MGQQLTRRSTSKHIISEKNLFRFEQNLLEFSNLADGELVTRNVQVGAFDDKPVYMRTFIFGHDQKLPLNQQTKPLLVFLHGFAASCCMFYKTYPTLREHFCVLMIDMVGMGSSSRPNNFNQKGEVEEVIDYLVDYVEAWRIKIDLS